MGLLDFCSGLRDKMVMTVNTSGTSSGTPAGETGVVGRLRGNFGHEIGCGHSFELVNLSRAGVKESGMDLKAKNHPMLPSLSSHLEEVSKSFYQLGLLSFALLLCKSSYMGNVFLDDKVI